MAKKSGAPTKSDVVNQICKDAELSRKQVAAVFESLNGIIKKSLRGHGMFTLPGLVAKLPPRQVSMSPRLQLTIAWANSAVMRAVPAQAAVNAARTELGASSALTPPEPSTSLIWPSAGR